MTIKMEQKGKKFWLSIIFIGVIIMGITGFYSYKNSLNQAEKSLVRKANYMKVQCSTYTHYNEGSETQALLRAIESNEQISQKVDDNFRSGNTLSEDYLKKLSQDLWVSGILVFDNEGNKVESYNESKKIEKKLLNNVNKTQIVEGSGYINRKYCQRITLTDGSYINMAMTARKDQEGTIISYYYISAKCAQDYSLTIQSLLDGYQKAEDGILMVADEGKVVASNNSNLIGSDTADNVIVQKLKEHADSKSIVHVREKQCYGVMVKQRDYYIYAYLSDSKIFMTLPQNVLISLFIYALVVGVYYLLMENSKRNLLKVEMEKEKQFKQQLIDSEKRAVEANASKTIFLQRMSHDIRTPINGIYGMLDVADYYSEDLEKQAECRLKIRGAANILLELINEVLDMGKINSKKY